jgi:hypothetical protein
VGLKSYKFSIEHVAKILCFVFIFFVLKPNQKIWRTLLIFTDLSV